MERWNGTGVDINATYTDLGPPWFLANEHACS